MTRRAAEDARVWVLNLDAEHELEAGPRYAPTRQLAEIVARESERLRGGLVAPGDVVLDGRPLAPETAERVRGLPGLAWSPTPRALRLLASAGARLPSAPDVAVLRAVNARPFAAAVRAPLAAESFAKHVAADLDSALTLLARSPAPFGDGWMVRRTFGAAGRGRRRLAAGAPAAWTEAERAWLVASLRLGPLVIEPWVRVTREYTRSAWVTPRGEVVLSPPCFQETTASGAWTRTERAGRGEVPHSDDARLAEAVEAAGAALAAAGYSGPFGIDAFRHRGPHGDVLNPLSEINARFTMDWTTAMSAMREPLAREARGAEWLASLHATPPGSLERVREPERRAAEGQQRLDVLGRQA